MTCGKRYLALLLCLLLLAGCGGNPYRDIPAPPEQPPEERQAVFADQEASLLDESWTPEQTDLDSDFTQEEQNALLQVLDPLDPTPELREAVSVTVEEARSDVDLAFRLLRHSYGAYDYFGGDEVFLPLKEAALAALPEEGTVSPEALEKALADALGPVLVLDLRGNIGGNSGYIESWFAGYTGQAASTRAARAIKLSPLNRQLYLTYIAPLMDMPEVSSLWWKTTSPGTVTPREGLTLVLQDKGTGSSGETAVRLMRTVENTLTIGGCTSGSCLTPNVFSFYLPHSGVTVRFGTGLGLYEDMTNRDGKGWLPDLWVPSGQAQERARKMIEYYDLTELFAD